MDINLSPLGMFMAYLLLIPGIIVLWRYRIPLIGRSLYAVFRMSVQLLLVGLYLGFLFERNSLFWNLLWLTVMIGFACGATISQCQLRWRKVVLPCLAALSVSGLSVLFYFVFAVAGKNLYSASLVIPIAGMLFGNSMRSNIVSLERFYTDLRKDENTYIMKTLYGATRKEALLPYIREAVQAGIRQHIASMITVGTVSLPGMMSGQMLGGSPPWVAIKYQIAIMVGIFAITSVSTVSLIEFCIPGSFKKTGMLDHGIFKKQAEE